MAINLVNLIPKIGNNASPHSAHQISIGLRLSKLNPRGYLRNKFLSD